MRLAHPPGDQLGVLRAVVDDEDEVGLHCAESTEAPGRSEPSGDASSQRQRKPVSSSLTCHSRRASFSSCGAACDSRAGPIGAAGLAEAPRAGVGPRLGLGRRRTGSAARRPRRLGGQPQEHRRDDARQRLARPCPAGRRPARSPTTPGCAAVEVTGRSAGVELAVQLQREQQVGQLGVRVGALRVVGLADVAVEHPSVPPWCAIDATRDHPALRRPRAARQQQPGQHEVAEVVGAELQLEAVRGASASLRRGHHAGVVDQQVERAVPRLGEVAAPTPSTPRSSWATSTSPPGRGRMRSAAASAAVESRQASTTRAPCAASWRRCGSRCRSSLPVTTAVRPSRSGRPSAVHPMLRNLRAIAESARAAAGHTAPWRQCIIRTRVWRNGTLEAENFPFEQVSDYLEEPDCLVWADLLRPDHETLLPAGRGAQPRPARHRGREARPSARRPPATRRTCS